MLGSREQGTGTEEGGRGWGWDVVEMDKSDGDYGWHWDVGDCGLRLLGDDCWNFDTRRMWCGKLVFLPEPGADVSWRAESVMRARELGRTTGVQNTVRNCDG